MRTIKELGDWLQTKALACRIGVLPAGFNVTLTEIGDARRRSWLGTGPDLDSAVTDASDAYNRRTP